jgi:hypothetical protein
MPVSGPLCDAVATGFYQAANDSFWYSMDPLRAFTPVEAVAGRIAPFHEGDERLGVLMSLCVGRVMLKAAKLGEDVTAVASDSQLGHVRDWLKAAIVNDAEWLRNVDEAGRPKKLMKFGTVAAVLAEADKAMLAAAHSLSGVKLIEGDEALLVTLDDGYQIVRLLTPAALDRESAEMQHCIGDGAYDAMVGDPGRAYLSLRSPSGKPHATLEVVDDEITQISGKQNRMPVKAHLDRLIPFVRGAGYGVAIASSRLGYAIDVDGAWHGLDALPDGLKVRGDLVLGEGFAGPLPDGLEVGGSLYLGNSDISTLPENLKVGGSLQLPIHTVVDALPEGLHVGGQLTVYRLKNRSFPEKFFIGGDLFLSGSTVNLPDGLRVGGSLFLRGTEPTCLPDGLSVGGQLSMRYSRIAKLPENLEVGGDLDLTGTPISELPKGLRVGGSLCAYMTAISALPTDLVVCKGMDFRGTKLSSLPEGVTVGGDLLLGGSKVSVIPAGLRVAGKLDLDNLPISSLPDDIEVGDAITVFGTNLTSLPDSIADDTLVFDEDGETTAAAFRLKHANGYVKPFFQHLHRRHG